MAFTTVRFFVGEFHVSMKLYKSVGHRSCLVSRALSLHDRIHTRLRSYAIRRISSSSTSMLSMAHSGAGTLGNTFSRFCLDIEIGSTELQVVKSWVNSLNLMTKSAKEPVRRCARGSTAWLLPFDTALP